MRLHAPFTSRAIALVLLAVGLCTSAPLKAQEAESGPKLIKLADPELIRELARGYGTSQVTTDNVGDPMVKGKSDGLSYSIYFYDCQKAEKCTSVQYQAGFDTGKKVKIDLINEWNVKKRFAKAELNSKGEGVLRMDYSMIGGTTREHIDNAMDMWINQLKNFATHIGYRK